MTTSTNDITGDKIATKVNSDLYRSNYDAIFKKSEETKPPEVSNEEPVESDKPTWSEP